MLDPARLTFGASLGSFGGGAVPVPTLLDWAAELEALGLDAIWFRDHVLWHSPVLDPFVSLGALAARTSRVALGPGVLLLPLRSPAVVAKAIATLDQFSGGRALLGVGVGGEFPKEYEACGVPMAERGRRADEALGAIRALWTEERASFAGRTVRFTDAAMRFGPVQRPHPPIWVGGRSDAALARAGRLGDGWLAYFVTAEGFARRLAAARDRWRERGEVGAFGAGLVIYFHAAVDRDEAHRAARWYLEAEYRQPFGELVDRYCALGPPGECAAAIAAFIEAGARHIVAIPAGPIDGYMDQMRRFAGEVIPRLAGATSPGPA
jgi:probable F420-dependent oxidoreductase